MTAIAINRFHARYRCAAAVAGQRERLQRLLGEVIDSGLEAAVQRSGIDTAGELCIREVNALARLDMSEPDFVLAAKLALAIGDAIEAQAGKQSEDLVHYGSRAHALIDLTVAALGGDFTRAWAWRRLGLWDAESALSTASAVRLVLRALAAEPRHATTAIAHLARYPRLFDRLLQHASPPQLQGLGKAVMRAVGASEDLLLPPGEDLAAPRAIDVSRRIVQPSHIARATAASRSIDSALQPHGPVLAVLAILEVDPGLLRQPAESARALVHAVSDLLVGAADLEEAGGQDPSGSQDLSSSGARLRDRRPESKRSAAARPDLSHADPMASRDPLKPAEMQATPSEHPLPDVRRRAHTRFGGLLYLINLASRLGVMERIVQDQRLAERSPRWSLHQLAMALVPVAASDAAALAFAGLLPDSDPPCKSGPPPAEPEIAAIAELRAELLQALREVLDRRSDAEPLLIESVCRRTAEIIADPGWMEVRFSVDDVRTEIRAVGLDLDPGWVPWLGLVIKFAYA